jgi:ATP-binding cassette subfamily G (WHITE) protein 2 (PDR)
MSREARAGDGIYRTSSGRETYAPDGHLSNVDLAQRSESFQNEKMESSRYSSDGSTAHYLPIGQSTRQDKGEDDEHEKPIALERRNTHATIEAADRSELQRILSHQRTTIVSVDDPAVDPESSSFDLSKFLKMFRHQLAAEGIQMRKVSLVYRNLNVFGSGAALQLQKTVLDFCLAPLRVGELFSFGKKDHKKILSNFDGVVKSGELLIVLGRPGSGCSTLLKTMCGELHGLDTDEKSIIHYNGIPQKRMMKEFKGEAIYNQEVNHAYLTLSLTYSNLFCRLTSTSRI